METKLTIAEFKRIRWRVALALHTQPRAVFIDTVETDKNGYTNVNAILNGYYVYRVTMSGDTVIQIAREVG